MSNQLNKLSVITINYNNAKGLEKTIDSVCSQTAKNIEYIIIDGGSADESVNVIRQNIHNVKYWISEKDRGIYHAQNKGIAQATGEYLLFLNSGDTFSKNTIVEEALNYSFDKDIIYGSVYLDFGEGKRTLQEYPEKVTFNYFVNKGYLPHSSAFIKKELFNKIGLYNENFSIISDWEFFVKAIFLYQATYKRIPVAVSIFSIGGISTKPEGISNAELEKEKVFQKYFSAIIEDYRNFHSERDKINSNRYIKILKRLRLVPHHFIVI